MTEPIKGKDMANRFPIVAKAVSGLLEKNRNSYLLLVMGKMQGDAWGRKETLIAFLRLYLYFTMMFSLSKTL